MKPTPVLSYEHDGTQWVVKTDQGTVKARRALILATNAYTGEVVPKLNRRLAHSIVLPVSSWQMSTEPLSDELRASILPGRQAVSDTPRRLALLPL